MVSPHTAVCSWIFLHVFVLSRLPALGVEFNRLELEGTQEVYLYFMVKVHLTPPMVPSSNSKRVEVGCKCLLFTTSSDLSSFQHQHYLYHLSSTPVQFFHFCQKGLSLSFLLSCTFLTMQHSFLFFHFSSGTV
jgi:hypothetical protein